jgi:hypothetical protein
MSSKTLVQLKNEIRDFHKSKSYTFLADFYGVNKYYLWHIANDEEPKIPVHIAIKLGLVVFQPAPVCPRCGIVHVTKRCTANDKPRAYTRWADMPVRDVLWAIQNREEF